MKNFCILQVAFFSIKIVFVSPSYDSINLKKIIAESSIILAKYFLISQLHEQGFQTHMTLFTLTLTFIIIPLLIWKNGKRDWMFWDIETGKNKFYHDQTAIEDDNQGRHIRRIEFSWCFYYKVLRLLLIQILYKQGF